MNYPSSKYIIISIIIFIILTLILYHFTHKMIKSSKFYIITNLLLVSLVINFITMFIMIMTYNKVKFTPGPKGLKGFRGNIGPEGNNKEVAQCEKQSRNLGQEYIKEENRKLIRLQKPIII